jgi:glutathione reductase (NADPH)
VALASFSIDARAHADLSALTCEQTTEMEAKGIHFHKRSHIKSIQRSPNDPAALLATLVVGPNGEEQTLEVDQVLFAIGRKAMTNDIGLEALGIATDAKGDIQTDAFERTTVEGVYAVGDCTGKRLLTPVALAAGRRLSGRLFGPAHLRDLKLDYDYIPSVIFSHPPAGSVGLTEAEAREAHGATNVRCFTTAFGALPYKMMESSESAQPTAFKVRYHSYPYLCRSGAHYRYPFPRSSASARRSVSSVCTSSVAARTRCCRVSCS